MGGRSSSSINLLNLTAIILMLMSVLVISYSQSASIRSYDEESEEEEYIVDAPLGNRGLRSRFLASNVVINKGTRCWGKKREVCDGVWANKGKSLVYCCKTHCRNVLGDKNNCGGCGVKCGLGHSCCAGRCINVGSDANNCGNCNLVCAKATGCRFGFCAYA